MNNKKKKKPDILYHIEEYGITVGNLQLARCTRKLATMGAWPLSFYASGFFLFYYSFSFWSHWCSWWEPMQKNYSLGFFTIALLFVVGISVYIVYSDTTGNSSTRNKLAAYFYRKNKL
jgi:hypothetical protein